MREIKFRGFSINKKKWVYGNYNYTFEREYLSQGYDDVPPRCCYIDTETDYYEVYSQSIGQYTGLKDKNGKEIYEGDICNCREYECFGKVEWNNEEAGFYFCVVLEGGGFEEEHLYDYADELEVIGNIHDNPELLEVENDNS